MRTTVCTMWASRVSEKKKNIAVSETKERAEENTSQQIRAATTLS